MEVQTAKKCQQFFHLLQLLIFVEDFDYEVDSLVSTTTNHSARFRIINFRVRNFLRYTEVDTDLNARRGNQCPASQFKMEKEYTIFMEDMSQKSKWNVINRDSTIYL
jgi:hypothetical protein